MPVDENGTRIEVQDGWTFRVYTDQTRVYFYVEAPNQQDVQDFEIADGIVQVGIRADEEGWGYGGSFPRIRNIPVVVLAAAIRIYEAVTASRRHA